MPINITVELVQNLLEQNADLRAQNTAMIEQLAHYTVKALCRLAETSGIEMPICQSLNDILQKKIEAQTAFSNLFLRSMKEEF
jgi:glycerol-3-phosphate dehydrogenase